MEKTNYCKMGNYLSKCTLTDPKEQYKCLFFIKASKSALNPEQCGHYRPDYDDHCDNISAQTNAIETVVKKEEETKLDFSY